MSGHNDLKLEAVGIPVADVDRSKEFYGSRLGWRLDADLRFGDVRAVQFTPPGSGCSIHFGNNNTAAPGSAQGLELVVSDIEAARAELIGRGVEVGEFYNLSEKGRGEGLAPGRASYSSYADVSDPDGNGWIMQEVTTRLPGRVDPATTTLTSASDLANALRRAAAAHGEHEKRTGKEDPDWPDWYARYMVSEQAGTEPPQ